MICCNYNTAYVTASMMKEDIGHVKEIYETSFHDISYSCHQFSLVTPSQS